MAEIGSPDRQPERPALADSGQNGGSHKDGHLGMTGAGRGDDPVRPESSPLTGSRDSLDVGQQHVFPWQENLLLVPPPRARCSECDFVIDNGSG